MATTQTTATTRFWHPFADMGAVSQSELVIDRGEGVYVFDAQGRRYLDGTASLWYANLGHGRPDITKAVAAQMDRLAAYQTFGEGETDAIMRGPETRTGWRSCWSQLRKVTATPRKAASSKRSPRM
jgi:adenosylmethionine-8-amino-7-oxononanoate aminotransferase